MRSCSSVRSIVSATLALIGVLCVASTASAAISVSELVLDMQVPAGSEQTATFVVSNAGTDPENVRITYVDWWVDSSYNHQFLEPGSVGRTLQPYISFSPATFHLAAGDSQLVRVTVAAPPAGHGTYWGMLMVEGEAPPDDASQGTVTFQVRTRFGVKVYATLTGTEQVAGRVTRLNAETSERGLEFTLEFENLGNTLVTPAGWFEVRNVQSTTLWRSDFEGSVVLPEATVEFTHPDEAPQLAPGQYLLLGIVDYGGERLVGGQSILTVE